MQAYMLSGCSLKEICVLLAYYALPAPVLHILEWFGYGRQQQAQHIYASLSAKASQVLACPCSACPEVDGLHQQAQQIHAFVCHCDSCSALA